MIGQVFATAIFEPLFNALIAIYQVVPDLGVAIIILTVLIKAILILPSRSSIVAQKRLQEMQPKLQALQKKYKGNREELGRQTMKFYKENKVNPLSSCLPLLIQFPVLVGLYQVFLAVAKTDPTTGLLAADQVSHLYGQLASIYASKPIDQMFFGIANLSATNNWVFAIIAGLAQFWQSKMLVAKKPPKVEGAKDESMASAMSKQMTYMFPILIAYFTIRFPAGLGLYWIVSTLFKIPHQNSLFRNSPPTSAPTLTAPSKPEQLTPAP